MKINIRTVRRYGFTLVEMMIASALTMMILLVLAGIFGAAVDSFRRLKVASEQQARLRSVVTLLRRDLMAEHFGPSNSRGPFLSNQDFRPAVSNPPPSEGFFRIWQGTDALAPLEGFDLEGKPVRRATDHALHFTFKMPGNRREDYLTALLPSDLTDKQRDALEKQGPEDYREPGASIGQWAEVAWFLHLSGETTTEGIPLFGLYRRQRLVLIDKINSLNSVGTGKKGGADNRIPVSLLSQFVDMSSARNPLPSSSGFIYFSSLKDLTVPQRRLGMRPDDQGPQAAGLPLVERADGGFSYPRLEDEPGISPQRRGDDLVLPDVISFEIRALWDGPDPAIPPHPNQEFGYLPVCTDNPVFASRRLRVFDTWSSHSDMPLSQRVYDYGATSASGPVWRQPGDVRCMPLRIRILAIAVTIRIWDRRTEQTRQVTVIQDL